MSDPVTDLTEAALAADTACVGCALIGDAPAQPGWLVVTRADGLRVRIDGVAENSPAVAAVLALDLSDAAVLLRQRARTGTAAARGVDALSEEVVLLRALVAVALTEINVLRDWTSQFQAAVAAAGTLAALKTAVALLPTLQPRTRAQVIAALKDACPTEAQV